MEVAGTGSGMDSTVDITAKGRGSALPQFCISYFLHFLSLLVSVALDDASVSAIYL